jgi:hypothetical protein
MTAGTGGSARAVTTAPGPGPEGPAVIAYTTEDDDHAEVRQAAASHAREHGCAVILYDAEAPGVLSEPMPNQWGSEGEGDRFGDRLSADDLEFLGHAGLARQVRQTEAGIGVAGWLPKDHGPGALADYARSQGAHAIFVPDRLESIDELSSRLAGNETPTSELATPGVELRVVSGQESVSR